MKSNNWLLLIGAVIGKSEDRGLSRWWDYVIVEIGETWDLGQGGGELSSADRGETVSDSSLRWTHHTSLGTLGTLGTLGIGTPSLCHCVFMILQTGTEGHHHVNIYENETSWFTHYGIKVKGEREKNRRPVSLIFFKISLRRSRKCPENIPIFSIRWNRPVCQIIFLNWGEIISVDINHISDQIY